MDQNFIAMLLEIRGRLQKTLTASECMTMKLLGPRPSDKTNSPSLAQETVGTIIGDISRLTTQLQSALEEQHAVLGELPTPAQLGGGASNRVYA